MKTINKHTVLKEVRTNGTWKGYIAPNKVNSFHITNGWCLGMDVLLTSDRQGNAYYVSFNALEVEPLEEMINSFACYNCNSELGKGVRFWQ